MPLPAILGGLAGASAIGGLITQAGREREAERLFRDALAQYEAIGPVVQEYARGRDLDVGDERAVGAVSRALARGDRQLLAQLRERGLSGGAYAQAAADAIRMSADREGDVAAQLEASRPTRRAQRQSALTQYMQQLAQIKNQRSAAVAAQPNPFLSLASGLSSAAYGAAALEELGGLGDYSGIADAIRQTAGRATGVPGPTDGGAPGGPQHGASASPIGQLPDHQPVDPFRRGQTVYVPGLGTITIPR